MQENYFVFLRTSIKHKLSESLVFATLAAASLIATLGLTVKADAQIPPVDNAEVTNYAQSVLEMEPKRQIAFKEIKKLIGGEEIPKIVCNDPNSMNSLPNKAREIAVNYCNDSQNIVSANNLSIARFNQITVEIQSNADLKRQIYNTLLRLQNESASKSGARNSR
ncbi:MAG: DUF4168 domain-containing protein [Sphaerospermopsis kisseleviana]|uniref:DUF4168 domain-containing protein n=1 Tax=Sphaerospermopsis reniformis TaxID=531300 RepID=A0A480A718_9CYAN|nr:MULTISPECIES: DUF4168 domain-containing protein [Sphaerospermopsis]MBC5797377.1 DUF4168 domain-containing protein [Sphaerospermopsis sp. LEGE 00249]MBD2133263.1 DUF4168 domain-containing protein [Sphaerospermopsis sp. FACHB-1094]MBD2146899.1 DUF4168 domain-containing protein [Sphaerospermopsis sp. FACHB-1194]GCL39108.1 hypothetical protein SR1949_42300 [Sphaerospermopsis reniformis]